MKKCRLTIFLIAFLLFNSSHAGLFGPSNYEECIISEVKNAKTEAAANIIRQACMKKFPTKEMLDEKNKREEREKMVAKCRLTKNEDAAGNVFLSLQSNPGINGFLNNLVNRKLDVGSFQIYGVAYPYARIEFQNNNKVGVSGLLIGIGPKGNCSSSVSDYRATYYCTADSAMEGVSAYSSGSINCPNGARDAKGGWCVIGFRPMHNPWKDGLADTMNILNLCN